MKHFISLFIAFLITLSWTLPASVRCDDIPPAHKESGNARAGLQSGWMCLTTKKTVVYYQSEADLETLNEKLKVRRRSGFLGLFGGKESGSVTERLRKKIDYIFESAQSLLDMYNCKSKIKIMAYPKKDGVNSAYADIVSKYKFSSTRTDHAAFYFHKLETVYVSLETLTEGILAHELAHAVIDHYFLIRPPPKVAEMLAQYVDKHLKRETESRR
ncbi:MAG: hypothetical protein HWN68_06610 [Desulfobacterales bacterium]|nr:hypothetical protein [Desulfobacterales bacterium]